jgi:hypothetical protein
LITTNISAGGINISLWVIELLKKNSFHSAIFKRAEGKLLSLKSIWRPAVNPTGRLHNNNYIIIIKVWGINISLQELREKSGLY